MLSFRMLVSGTNFAQFADFVSPAFFQVMPAGKLLMQARSLVSAYRNRAAFEAAVASRAEALRRASLPIDLVDAVREGVPADPLERKTMGELVLTLYFHQILSPDPALIDLGKKRFTLAGDRLQWAARPGHLVWDERFRSALADVYRTFYAGDGRAGLERALEPLGLASAADIFVRHFGEGDQRAVAFRVESFVASFHAIFVHCKEHGITLHPQFLALGLCLASLYETLETLGGTFDVRQAFERASA